MSKKRHTAEEIVAKLRQVDVLTAQGRTVAEAIRQIGVTEVTYYRWRSEYGGLRQRGSLTVWFTEEAIAAWRAEPRTTRGGQAHYSALAIRTALTSTASF